MKAVIVAGIRTPFTKAGTDLKHLTAIELGKLAVGELMARSPVPAEAVDQIVYGTVVHDPMAPNIGREVGLATLPKRVPGSTVSLACASSNQAIVSGTNLIEAGAAGVVVAGGAESLSHIPILVSEHMSDILVAASKAKTFGERITTFGRFRPRDLVPRSPAIAEPTTGETMGQATERMAKDYGITREEQDEWALRSHKLAAAGVADGRIQAEIAPVYVPPSYDQVIDRDNGIRADTSMEKLATLKPVFDRRYGTLTAGNSSPLTDGASAVVLMSEERARADGVQALARIKGYAITAVDPGGYLLSGPAYAAPIALERAGVTMKDIGLMEMHEAFAAQVLFNLRDFESAEFAEQKLGRAHAVGHPPLDRINVMGGSVAIGHPFGATGGRITMTLVNEMRRRDVELGLMTVCAAGGMGFAMVVERV
jgi:acetyl-CoA acyltransferase